MAATSTTLAKGYSGVIKRVTGGTCTCANDVYGYGGGTCTCATMGSINSYQLTSNTNAETFNAFGDMVEKGVPLMSSYELTMSGGFDYGDTQQKAYWDNIISTSAHASEKLRITDTKAKHTVKAYLTQAQVGAAAAGLGTFSATWKIILFPKTCNAV
jgi:hypothetical protein